MPAPGVLKPAPAGLSTAAIYDYTVSVSKLTDKFIEDAASLNPRALIIEGTNVQRETNIAEDEVYQNGKKAIASAKGLVIADFSPRDVDRLLTFLQNCQGNRQEAGDTAQGCLSVEDHASSGAGNS